MTSRTEALLRLLAVQASWTYERMAGIGVGHAAAPLLRDVFAERSVDERREAIARSAEFFNSHPYLAGIAVGAVVAAEREHTSGERIARLRIALSGPLGALGDQLIWAGWVPVLVGLALAAEPWLGGFALVGAVVIHNMLRLWTTAWGLDLGLRSGVHVGTALQRSWLPRVVGPVQRAAGFAVGLAVPIVAWRGLTEASALVAAIVVLAGVVGALLAVAPATRVRVTGLRIGLVFVVVSFIVMATR
jgi:mannose/fructose/N-acetylgalactosamine-specific phosphotransferase system component IID